VEVITVRCGEYITRKGKVGDQHYGLLTGKCMIDHLDNGTQQAKVETNKKEAKPEDFNGMYGDEDILPYGLNIGGADVLEGDVAWGQSIVVIEDCILIVIDKFAWKDIVHDDYSQLDARMSMLSSFDILRVEPEHNIRELALVLEPYEHTPPVTGVQTGMVERGMVILKQDEKAEKVMFLVGKTQARLLREVTVDKERRVVEAGAIRSPGIANECCVVKQGSGMRRLLPRSTVLISNPGSMWVMDKFLFMKRVSKAGVQRMKEQYDADVTSEVLVQSYLEHRKWKKFKNRLVGDVTNPDLGP